MKRARLIGGIALAIAAISTAFFYARTHSTGSTRAPPIAASPPPENSRYGYVYAVALEENGESARAVEALQGVHDKHRYDRDVLIGLVSFNEALGNTKAATAFARKLNEVDPRYGSAAQIMEEVSSR